MSYEPDPSLPWAHRILLRVEVGSTAHGTGLDGHEDYDEMAIMSQPLDSLVGLAPYSQTITYRPGRGPEDRSGPGDYDLVVHTARKWASLAARGNPTTLMLLFGPVRASTRLGEALRAMPLAFYTDQARVAFLGYAQAQRERLMGVRGGRHTNRPELEAVHGYDTKYAMHMVRLGYQGIEYMETGAFTLPMPEPQRANLLAIRRGEVALADVLLEAQDNEAKLYALKGSAPAVADYEKINHWLLDIAAMQRWSLNRLARQRPR